MRILHTADWHVGRRLGRHGRTEEMRESLDEVVRIADDEQVDLVLVAGDVFDRATPPVESLSLGLSALLRLGEGRPVVVVAGNHDAPELFDALAPLMRDRGVHLIGRIKAPNAGGLLGPDELGVPAVIAGFPFLREGRVIDFMEETGTWYGAYADKIAKLTDAYNTALVERAGTDLVPILVAHFMVSGVRVSRSERELHIGDAYTATSQAIPAGPQYVALGHIHAPQPVPGAPVPAAYAGSLLPMDFGEAGEVKRVVIVDAEPGRLATLRSVPIHAGRPLQQIRGTWEEVSARAEELADSYLDLTIAVGGPDPELGRRAAALFPYLVRVRPERPVQARRERSTDARPSDDELYAAFVRATTGDDAPPELVQLFRETMEEVADAAS
ncbi:MAG TPA: exonuclease SbcCD subunit D [Actinomycetota bacterium]|nr:exonuclease SbcCD subunit D [Actinomycetota bacterium]